MEWDALAVPLRIRFGVFPKPFFKEFFHRASMSIAQVNVTQIIPMVEKQVANLSVLLQFLLA